MSATNARRRVTGEFLRFSVVGVVGFIVDSGTLYLSFALLGLGPYLGRVVSYLVAASTTWHLNRTHTFERGRDAPARQQWTRFVALNAIGGAINYATYSAVITSFSPTGLVPLLGVALGSLAGLAFNFGVSRQFVFR